MRACLRSHRLVLPSGITLIAASCSLDVRNINAPDVDQVFSSPVAIEQAIGSGYLACHNNSVGGSIVLDVTGLSLEGSTGLAERMLIPRGTVNSRAGAFDSGSGQEFVQLALNARLAANTVSALDALIASGGTLGTNAQNLRARAFGFFSVGCNQGWSAMLYDSLAIITPHIPEDSVPPFVGAQDAMRSAIQMLDTAMAIASSPAATASGGFPLPSSWMNDRALSRDEFVQLVRSYRARFRAGVARTPAERGQVNWSLVIADAEASAGSDFSVSVSPASGWINGIGISFGVTGPSMPPNYYAMADTSGGYDAWLATSYAERSAFLVLTPDRRWPQGATRSQQQTNSIAPTNFGSRPFVMNRPTNTDPAVGSPLNSFYSLNRLAYIRANAFSGAYPEITKAEMDLLAAEGYLRAGNIAAAAAKIDVTRVNRGQLPALTGVISSLGQPVPGGRSCVPRIPAPPAFTSTQCGDIWEAMKWEKRMETAFTGYAQWYFDSRGWGDLVTNTAYELPVPSPELAARHKPDYALGGGLASSAAKGTYGF